jgi:hypothetical protein
MALRAKKFELLAASRTKRRIGACAMAARWVFSVPIHELVEATPVSLSKPAENAFLVLGFDRTRLHLVLVQLTPQLPDWFQTIVSKGDLKINGASPTGCGDNPTAAWRC